MSEQALHGDGKDSVVILYESGGTVVDGFLITGGGPCSVAAPQRVGGGFYVYDKNGQHFADVKGNFIGFNYRVLTPDHAVELGKVTKKWGGVAKELFTSADTYMVEIEDDLNDQPLAKMLVLAAALATDLIFKSESRTIGLDLGGD